MVVGVSFCGFNGVMGSVVKVTDGDLRMVSGAMMVACFVVAGGLAVMTGGVFVVFGGFVMMVGC